MRVKFGQTGMIHPNIDRIVWDTDDATLPVVGFHSHRPLGIEVYVPVHSGQRIVIDGDIHVGFEALITTEVK